MSDFPDDEIVDTVAEFLENLDTDFSEEESESDGELESDVIALNSDESYLSSSSESSESEEGEDKPTYNNLL